MRKLIPLLLIIPLSACREKEYVASTKAQPPDCPPVQPVPVPVVQPEMPDDQVEALTEERGCWEVGDPIETITRGVTYQVVQGSQEAVMNPTPVDDGVWRFARGSACRVDPCSTVQAIGTYHDKELNHDFWLVRYTRPQEPEPMLPDDVGPPYQCPTGAVYFLEDASILIEAEEPDERFEVARKLLRNESR